MQLSADTHTHTPSETESRISGTHTHTRTFYFSGSMLTTKTKENLRSDRSPAQEPKLVLEQSLSLEAF